MFDIVDNFKLNSNLEKIYWTWVVIYIKNVSAPFYSYFFFEWLEYCCMVYYMHKLAFYLFYKFYVYINYVIKDMCTIRWQSAYFFDLAILTCMFWCWNHNLGKNRTTIFWVGLKSRMLLDSNSCDKYWCYFGLPNFRITLRRTKHRVDRGERRGKEI